MIVFLLEPPAGFEPAPRPALVILRVRSPLFYPVELQRRCSIYLL